MAPRRWITDAVVLATYFGYYAYPEGPERMHVYYIAYGVLAAWLGYILYKGVTPSILACALLISEGGQQAICGSFKFGSIQTGEDLCVMLGGEDIYKALGSMAFAALVVIWLNQRRNSRS